MTLAELFSGRSMDINKVMTRLRRVADEVGVPFGEQEKTYNSRLAQELGLWAAIRGKEDEFHEAAFKAFFADGENIGKVPVLLELAESVDLPREEAQGILETRAFREAVDSDWEEAREKEISVIPTFVIRQKKLAGFQPYESLKRFMADNHVKRRE